MCMYVCVYVEGCSFVCLFVFLFVCLFVCLYNCGCMNLWMHESMDVCFVLFVCVRLRMYVWIDGVVYHAFMYAFEKCLLA